MKLALNQELNKENLKGIYIEQKALLVPVLSILISIFLFLFFLLPQLTAFPAKKTEIDSEEKKLDTIKKATEFARVSNPLVVDEDLKIAGQVLPVEKDFEGILNAISAASNASGVVVGQYQFTLNSAARNVGVLSGIPFLIFTVSVDGDPQQVLDFANELYKTAPVSEITEINYSNNAAAFTILFYYKPITPAGFEDGSLVRKMTPVEESTINDIKEWSLPLANLSEIQVIPASGSGSLSESPL